MEYKFKIGEVVQLKSGGSKMTVQKIDSFGVSCVWMSNDNVCQKEMFHPETLEKSATSKSVRAFSSVK